MTGWVQYMHSPNIRLLAMILPPAIPKTLVDNSTFTPTELACLLVLLAIMLFGSIQLWLHYRQANEPGSGQWTRCMVNALQTIKKL